MLVAPVSTTSILLGKCLGGSTMATLFPLSGLPGWLTVLTHVNPMTYAVEPMRSVVFDRLPTDAATRARFDPGIHWGAWTVPVVAQVGLVLLACALLLTLAVRRFRRTT